MKNLAFYETLNSQNLPGLPQ